MLVRELLRSGVSAMRREFAFGDAPANALDAATLAVHRSVFEVTAPAAMAFSSRGCIALLIECWPFAVARFPGNFSRNLNAEQTRNAVPASCAGIP
jgi:hypothetical protein